MTVHLVIRVERLTFEGDAAGGKTRKAPAQAELRPTSARTSRVAPAASRDFAE
jgi:hypothetical protein